MVSEETHEEDEVDWAEVVEVWLPLASSSLIHLIAKSNLRFIS